MLIDGERLVILYDFLRACTEGSDAVGMSQERFYAIHKTDIDSIIKDLEKET